MSTGESSRHQLEDGDEALRWFRGTEAAKVLHRSPDSKCLIDYLRDYYREIVEPFFSLHKTKIANRPKIVPTLHGFFRAYALVSSRAFVVDAYHGLCMVPVADAFNHGSQNHVHLESDYYVCPECGSLHECSHDRVDSTVPATSLISSMPRVTAADEEGQKEDDCHMVSVTEIPPGVEVFNTYGETLTNAQLLIQYGFILEVNDRDTLTWDVEEIIVCISSGADELVISRHWKQVCQQDWTSLSKSGLIYVADPEPERDHPLTLNGDGKISRQLWIVVALFSLGLTVDVFSNGNSGLLLAHLCGLLDVQSVLEGYLEFEDGRDVELPDCNTFDPALLRELGQLCKLMLLLCTDRKLKTGLVGFPATVSHIGEYFDVGHLSPNAGLMHSPYMPGSSWR
ncbi:hypothetical protein AX15_004287 [Amanita polypyramis BW_CC]|nr:hypothetical protein AX15_004287 [Amanita polypyramis BW_CC]